MDMDEYRIVYTNHARERMFERGIREEEIDHVLAFGLSRLRKTKGLYLSQRRRSLATLDRV